MQMPGACRGMTGIVLVENLARLTQAYGVREQSSGYICGEDTGGV